MYEDMIMAKFPDKFETCRSFLQKEELSELDVIKLNNLIFNNISHNRPAGNGKFRSYKESTIIEILDYQKANHLNNSDIAKIYGISRNTLMKWQKLFLL